jgi:hypothetical protein
MESKAVHAIGSYSTQITISGKHYFLGYLRSVDMFREYVAQIT